MTYYGTRFGCRWGQPHDFIQIKDAATFTVEVCRFCRTRRKWNKAHKSRIDNPAYLKDHVRQFAQSFGATKRVYMKLYQPEKTIIRL